MTRGRPLEPSLAYRADIDGLRAVAVLAVVFYHLGLPFQGGFVGVDIFFTISGFLIGSIILRQTTEGSFNFARFYERRVRRIFPALFAMLYASSVLAYLYIVPRELPMYGRTIAAAAFSISNFYFYNRIGYFDPATAFQPLIHTWTLGIEEQFYLVLPALIVLVSRFAPRALNATIGLLALVSFGLSSYWAYSNAPVSFYLTHMRAWELLCGVILACDIFPRIHRPTFRHLAGLGGAVLIGLSCWLYNRDSIYPGIAALAPCVGAALIIAAGQTGSNVVGRILSFRPVAFIGLISYSLYLWHWPLIGLAAYEPPILNGLDHRRVQLLLFSASMVIAWLSWRFIETPFRVPRPGKRPLQVFVSAAIAVMLATGIGLATVVTRGAPWRFPARAVEVAAYTYGDPRDPRDQYRNDTCLIGGYAPLHQFSFEKCLADKPGEPTILLLGDSHAAALWWGFDRVFRGTNSLQATAIGCKPVVRQRPRQQPSCTWLMNYMFTTYLLSHRLNALVIAARWQPEDLPDLDETTSWLKERGIPLILVGPMEEYDASLPRLLAFAIARPDPLLPQRHLIGTQRSLDRKMQAMARDRWRVPYISLTGILCQEDACLEYAAPGVPLLMDGHHLTKLGSELVARKIAALGLIPVTVASALVE